MKATLEEHKAFAQGMSESIDYGLRLKEVGIDDWTIISILDRQIRRYRQLRDGLYRSYTTYYYHGHVRGYEEVLRQIANKKFLG